MGGPARAWGKAPVHHTQNRPGFQGGVGEASRAFPAGAVPRLPPAPLPPGARDGRGYSAVTLRAALHTRTLQGEIKIKRRAQSPSIPRVDTGTPPRLAVSAVLAGREKGMR